jgi:hypothetical protein
MRRFPTTAAVTAALALMAAPAFALPTQAPTHPGNSDHQVAQSKGKAYGKHCGDQSKKHVAGEKGTAFSRCVTAMAKLADGTTTSPRAACKTESKKHVAGEKGTAFSRCVSAGAKLLEDKADEDDTADEQPAG